MRVFFAVSGSSQKDAAETSFSSLASLDSFPVRSKIPPDQFKSGLQVFEPYREVFFHLSISFIDWGLTSASAIITHTQKNALG